MHSASRSGSRVTPDAIPVSVDWARARNSSLAVRFSSPCEVLSRLLTVDIAREQLEASCNTLAQAFPALTMIALRADFALPLALPISQFRHARRRVLYFPGSTIGNFTPADAHAFLARWAPTLGAGGGALIGVDLKKAPALLDAAYNDAQRVTAAFNLNLLMRINRELGADFD